MAATADPRAKAPATQPHHIKPWAPPPPPRGHRVPSLPAVSGAAGANRDRRRSSTSHRHGGADAVDEEPYDGGLEDLRAKLMGHLHGAADRLRLPPAKPHRSPEPVSPTAPVAELGLVPSDVKSPKSKTYMPSDVINRYLMGQKLVLITSMHGDYNFFVMSVDNIDSTQLRHWTAPQEAAAVVAASMPWTLRERKRRPSSHGSMAASPATPWSTTVAATARDDGVRAPFAVALEAEEIEEDVYALTGARPRRRPRKRSRVVQRQLDSLFPGLWLTEITADAYRVPDD